MTTVRGALQGPASVVVATAGPATINNQPGGVGSISAAPQDIATVSLNVQGVTAPIQITSVDVLASQLVAAGAPLVQLDPAPFEQNVRGIRLTLEQDQAALASAQAAASAATASAGGYLAVQVPTLEGQVAIDEQLLQIAEGNSNTITAPIAGYVSSVRVSPGQIVNPGASLVQIVNPAQVVVNAGMQLSDLQSIAVGDAATITPSQLPDVHLHGTVVAVSAAATGDGLEGTVVVTAPNLPDHPVPIGTQSIVNVSAPQHAAVSVPTLAVLNVQIAPVVGVVRQQSNLFPARGDRSVGRNPYADTFWPPGRASRSRLEHAAPHGRRQGQGILGRHMSFTAVNLPARGTLRLDGNRRAADRRFRGDPALCGRAHLDRLLLRRSGPSLCRGWA